MSDRRVVIVGAGLSGLACAFDLARAGHDVTILDAAAQAGGVVGTLERDGFRFETGPTTVPASAAAFRALCGEVGLADRLVASSPAADERYLFHRGKLRTLPATPTALMSSSILSLSARLYLASELVRRFDASRYADEPDLEAFFTERIGPEPTRLLAGAFVRGVYAAELHELGVQSAFPTLWAAAVEHGSLIRGLRATEHATRPTLPGPQVARTALLSFPKGLQELVDALARWLGSRLVTRARVERLERIDGGWRVLTAGGARHDAARVVLALAAPRTAELLAPVASVGVPLDSLRSISHARLTLVHLGLDASEVPGFLPGFGYLVPPPAGASDSVAPRVLGTLFTSNLFAGRAPAGSIAVSSFYTTTDVEGFSEAALGEEACRDLARALGLARTPRAKVALTQHWSDVIPRYAPGHAERMHQLLHQVETLLPGIHLAGCYTAGISVDQVILRGRVVAGAIAKSSPREGVT